VFAAVHIPPEMLSLKANVEPIHTGPIPVITGLGLTVTIVVLAQPVPTVNDIVVVPAYRPVTVRGDPDEPIVAIPVLVLLHTPPDDKSLNVVVRPTHTEFRPVIGAGTGMTVTMVVALAVQAEPAAVTVTV
jgi:hypothetical protein